MLIRAYTVMNLGILQSILVWQLRWGIRIHKRNLGEMSNYVWKTAGSGFLLLKTLKLTAQTKMGISIKIAANKVDKTITKVIFDFYDFDIGQVSRTNKIGRPRMLVTVVFSKSRLWLTSRIFRDMMEPIRLRLLLHRLTSHPIVSFPTEFIHKTTLRILSPQHRSHCLCQPQIVLSQSTNSRC
jgi:hypothetical protein